MLSHSHSSFSPTNGQDSSRWKDTHPILTHTQEKKVEKRQQIQQRNKKNPSQLHGDFQCALMNGCYVMLCCLAILLNVLNIE